jgi:hypothetical protein
MVMVVRLRDTPRVTGSDPRDDMLRDRAAIEAVAGRGLAGDWPEHAMPAGARVRVTKDDSWDGPWRQAFTGTVDETVTPRLVENRLARPGELEYSVRFDEPQNDVTDLGSYRKAVIWARYLERI